MFHLNYAYVKWKKYLNILLESYSFTAYVPSDGFAIAQIGWEKTRDSKLIDLSRSHSIRKCFIYLVFHMVCRREYGLFAFPDDLIILIIVI